MIFTINDCTVDTDAYEVRRHGSRVAVEPQVFDLLVQLLENRDRLVTKDEIIARVWRGRIVSDASVSSRIKAVRQAIGDDGAAQACIRTVRRRGFRVVADVTQQAAAPAALAMPAGPGIAVLHFDLSGDPALNFFGGAVTAEITTELTRYSELRIVTRARVAAYDRNDVALAEIGRSLGVEYLVQGTLQRAGGRMRASARLLKADDGTVLWGESYELDPTPADVFSVQEDVAAKVVAAIASISGGVIAREKLKHARGKPPREVSAYASVLRVNEVMASGFSAESHRATRTCLEAAVATEPDYAAAWAMLAVIHTVGYAYGYDTPGTDPLQEALAAARRAIELAPGNPMARFAMARTAYLRRDMELFRAEAAHALRLNPHDPFLLGNLGNWLAFSGSWDEGVALVRKAIVLNPKVYPSWWHAALGKDRYRKGQYRQALAEFKTMNLPDWWWNQVELAYTYGQLGDLDNARTAVAKLLALYPGFTLATAVEEHRKFSFEPSYIDLAVDGLRKAGVPEGPARQP